MAVTIPVQLRLEHSLVKLADERATATGTSRAQVLRELLVTGLATPQAAPASKIDAQLDRILDALARLDVKADWCGEMSEHAAINGFAAYATARLHALKVLPQDQQTTFVGQLVPIVAKVVQP